MHYEWLISFRYLKSKRKYKFISLISLISILGIAIGVCALIVVISVMNGFDQDLMQKIMGMNAHIAIEKNEGISEYEDLILKLEQEKNIKAVAPSLLGQVIIRHQSYVKGILLKGIIFKQEEKISDLGKYIIYKESLNQEETNNTIIIGKELAKTLDAEIGDEIEIISPASMIAKGKREPIIITLKVKNIFDSGMYEHDANLAFVDLQTCREIFGLKRDIVSQLQVKLNKENEIKETKERIQNLLGEEYFVSTWFEQNKNLFSAIQLEKTVMFLILILIVLVAAFNIVSTLIMLVIEKTKDIAILKALGVSSYSILKIFSLEGFLIGAIGTLIGAGTGLGLCVILKKYNFIKLPNDIYYVTSMPVSVDPKDVVLIVSCSLVISMIAAIYPAYKAACLNPVEALRYE